MQTAGGRARRTIPRWTPSACFPTDPDDTPYGFAFGALTDHAERGEEQFVVRFDASDESVWFALSAVSRPRTVLRLGGPVSRILHRRFRNDAARAMMQAMGRNGTA
jgi:uncharacterized protein (UPF0548 family)